MFNSITEGMEEWVSKLKRANTGKNLICALNTEGEIPAVILASMIR